MKTSAQRAGAGFLCITAMALSGDAVAAPFSYTNSSPIQILDSVTLPTKASPYPSALTVNNLAGLTTGRASVAVYGLTHSYPSDVTLMLVGPQGQRAILMALCGGNRDPFPVTNLNLSFDDSASQSLPVYTSLTPGTFKPTNGYVKTGKPGLWYDLPAPAPPGNSNSVSSLSVFRNTNPNGVWNLFVVDDAGGSSGVISYGWSLQLDAGVPLSVTQNGTNCVVSWPDSLAGAVLQYSLAPGGGWTSLTAGTQIAGRFWVTNRILGSAAFYRLIK